MLYNDDGEEPKRSHLGKDFLPVVKNKISSFYISKLSVTIIIFAVLAVVVIFNIVYSAIQVKENEQAKELVQNLYSNETQVATENNNAAPEKKEENIEVAEPVKDNREEIGVIETDKIQGNHATLAAHDISELFKNKQLPVQIENAQERLKNLFYQTDKWVFLTFDDGPTSTITPQILEILRNENVKATFFVLGKMVDRNQDLVRQEYEEGHYIANHGYSHEYKQIYSSVDSVWDEFNRTEDSIRVALNNPEYHSFLFRFPGGSAGGKYANLKAQAKQRFIENNIGTINWNALTGDAEGDNTVEAQLAKMQATTEGDDVVVLLMHDAYDKQVTVETLPHVIEYYRNLGYEFKTFYDVFK